MQNAGKRRTKTVGTLAYAAVVVLGVPLATFAGGEVEEPALKGYCPVSFTTVEKAIKGDPAIASKYRGRIYQFANAEAKELFDAKPEKFLPQFDGLCTTALGGSYGNRLPGDPEVFVLYGGKVYLFSSDRARRAYVKRPAEYRSTGAERFSKPALDGYCPISYQLHNRPVKGNPTFPYVYRGWIYHLAGAEAMAKFDKDPAKYLPQYDGFCVLGVAKGKRYPADPTVHIEAEGRTYLFFDKKSKQEFMLDPRGYIAEADKNWPTVREQY